MTRLSRLVGIILHLQGKRLVRAEDLAEYFDVSVRTIYRDLRALEDGGLPLYAEAGKGYSLVDGYNLPPVMFTQEEASALLIGGALAERLSDRSLRPHVSSALMKVNAVLPAERKEHAERLHERTSVHFRRAPSSVSDRANLATLQGAVAGRRVVRIRYTNRTRDQVTEREIEPLGLVYYADNWHVLAWCRLREDIRDFRADRIEEIEGLQEIFPERRDFSVDEHMQDFFRKGGGHIVRVRFSMRAAEHTMFAESYGLIEHTERNGGVEMAFSVPSLDWIAHWLLSFAGEVTILEPEELKTMMTGFAEDILRANAPQ